MFFHLFCCSYCNIFIGTPSKSKYKIVNNIETLIQLTFYEDVWKKKSEWFIQLLFKILFKITDNFLLLVKCMIINDFIDIQLQL